MARIPNVRDRLEPDQAIPALDDRYRSLTRREREVAALLVFGMSRNEIAEELSVNPRTVDTHRGHVLTKMQCPNEVALVWRAFEIGWVK